MVHALCMLDNQGYTHTRTQNMQYVPFFHCNSGYSNAHQRYVIHKELQMAIQEVTSGIQRANRKYTGLFISPSGISELDCATTKTDTAERSISKGRESLQVSVLPYRWSICAPLMTRQMSIL